MQKLSVRKISILGLVLMAASAVTAAMIPSKSDKKGIKFQNGSLTNRSAVNDANAGDPDSKTCAPDSALGGISTLACTASSQLNASATTTGKIGGTPGTSDTSVSSTNNDFGAGEDQTSSDHEAA